MVAAFLAAIPATILSAALLASWAIGAGASDRFRLLFRFLCHGLPQRSLELFGTTMPICARCTGIYAGLLAGVIVFVLIGRSRGARLSSPAPFSAHFKPAHFRTAMLIALLPMAIDGLSQAAGLRESTNALRIVTGVVAAFAFGLWVLSSVERASGRAFHTS